MSLSRRALVGVNLIILLAIVGIWSGEPLAGLWRWPAIFLLLLTVCERLQLGDPMDIKREIAAPVLLGQSNCYQQSVSNHSKHVLLIDCQPDYPDALAGDQSLQRWRIASGETQSRQFSITPVALGTDTLGQLYLRILGKFGLIWWTKHLAEQTRFKVEPTSSVCNQPVVGQVRSGGRKTRYKPGAGFELLTLRDYHYGDSQQNIDWKASARRQKPMVREYSQEQRLEIALLVDCGRGSFIQCGLMDRLHHYVNIATRLTDFAVAHDDQVACIAYADKIISSLPMTGGTAAVKQSRQLLADLAARPEESNPLNVALELRRYLKRRSLVIFLTEIEQAEAATQLIQAVKILQNKHHIVLASIDDPAISRLIKQPANNWLAPYQNFAAHEYIRGRELTCHKLKQTGISVITSPAEKLDAELLSYYQSVRERREV